MDDFDDKYKLFFERSPDLLCIAGYDGYFRKVNGAVAKTLGYSMEELYARPINDFVHPDDKEVTAKVRGELTRSKPLHHFENRYLTKGGEVVWLSWTSLPVESDGLIFAIAKNITHKKRLEEDRNALLAKVTRMNKDLMQLNYATSNDLKSPVHSLLALFDLMDVSKVNDKETVELLVILQYLGKKVDVTLNKHVEELVQRNNLESVAEQTDLQLCLGQVIESISTLIETSRTTILVDFSGVSRIRFSNAYMKSIFLNVVTNSIKYASPDRLPVISLRSEKTDGSFRLIIADNGSGFDARKMERELADFPQRFQRDLNSKGIGLFLIYSQVRAYGGDVDVTSTIGEGTSVVIKFPNAT